jgi:hypothetical protein
MSTPIGMRIVVAKKTSTLMMRRFFVTVGILLNIFVIYDLRFTNYELWANGAKSAFAAAKLRKISLLGAKKGIKQLFFMKKVIFF